MGLSGTSFQKGESKMVIYVGGGDEKETKMVWGKMALNPSRCIDTHQSTQVTLWRLIFLWHFLKLFDYLLFGFPI